MPLERNDVKVALGKQKRGTLLAYNQKGEIRQKNKIRFEEREFYYKHYWIEISKL